MKTIPLTQGKFALIDDEDFEMVSLFKWYASKIGYTFYAISDITTNKKKIMLLMHRLIMNLKPHEQIDHKDRNGLNNQKSNMRFCTQAQNLMNRRSNKNSSSEYKGVHWHIRDKKWIARIKINKKSIHLGYFKDESEAARAYNKKAIELFGVFANLNNL